MNLESEKRALEGAGLGALLYSISHDTPVLHKLDSYRIPYEIKDLLDPVINASHEVNNVLSSIPGIHQTAQSMAINHPDLSQYMNLAGVLTLAAVPIAYVLNKLRKD